MENKNNFTGIIITVIIAVILLTVLPIINSMNVECPPCEECPSYNIGNVEVNPDFSSGDYIVDKGSYDYIDSATIIKDVDLIPENIKKDVNIYGVVGTYEGSASGGYDLELSAKFGGMEVLVKDIYNAEHFYTVSIGDDITYYLKNITWVKLIFYGDFVDAVGLTVSQAKTGHTLTQNSSIYTNHD